MPQLSDELNRLRGYLQELGLPVVRFLLPGTASENVVSALGGVPPASVIEWFGWCNGVRGEEGQIQNDVEIIPGYNPLSVEEAVRRKRYYLGDPILGLNWVPLLFNPSGDIYAAVWDDSGDAVVADVLNGEETEIEFGSIFDMVKYFNECYARGAFYVDDNDGWVAMDPKKATRVYDSMFGG